MLAEVSTPLVKSRQSETDLVLMLLDKLMINMVYLPPDAHDHSTLFEARLTLPVAARLDLSVAVVEGFLSYTQHPPDPDAQRSDNNCSGWNASVGDILI